MVAGILPVSWWGVAEASQDRSSLCAGLGPDCHNPPGLSVIGAILTIALGSILPAAIALTSWLYVRSANSAALVGLAIVSGMWGLIGLATLGAGGWVILPSAVMGFMALIAGLTADRSAPGSVRNR